MERKMKIKLILNESKESLSLRKKNLELIKSILIMKEDIYEFIDQAKAGQLPQKFLQIIDHHPLRHLGSGAYGAAFEINDDIVLKIGLPGMNMRDDLAIYEKLQAKAFSGEGSPNLPMIYDYGQLSNNFLYVLIQKVIPRDISFYPELFSLSTQKFRERDILKAIDASVTYYLWNKPPPADDDDAKKNIFNLTLKKLKKNGVNIPLLLKSKNIIQLIASYIDSIYESNLHVNLPDTHIGNIGRTKFDPNRFVQFDF